MDNIGEQVRKMREQQAASTSAADAEQKRQREQAEDFLRTAQKVGPLLVNVVAAKQLAVPITESSRQTYTFNDVRRTGLFGGNKPINESDRQRLRTLNETEEARLRNSSKPGFYLASFLSVIMDRLSLLTGSTTTNMCM
jgi:hypothetical protein